MIDFVGGGPRLRNDKALFIEKTRKNEERVTPS